MTVTMRPSAFHLIFPLTLPQQSLFDHYPPLLIYDILIEPFVLYIAAGFPGPYWHFYTTYVLSLRGIQGPVWFIEALLFFVMFYALWRVFSTRWSHAHPRKTAPTRSITSAYSASLPDDWRNAPIYRWPGAVHFCDSDLVPDHVVVPAIAFQCRILSPIHQPVHRGSHRLPARLVDQDTGCRGQAMVLGRAH